LVENNTSLKFKGMHLWQLRIKILIQHRDSGIETESKRDQYQLGQHQEGINS
jgi:hypothetical protein